MDTIIAFDADDTLWSNEPFFQEVERRYVELLKPYVASAGQLSAELFRTEVGNLEILGFGAKAFTISMLETALRVTGNLISADEISQIIMLGKSLLQIPVEPLPGVKETLEALKGRSGYKLIVATKGDLLDQKNKLKRSALDVYFEHIEVMSDKTEAEYLRLLKMLQVPPERFVMVGNSLKSDIQPVLAIGGKGIHIPFEIMWQHEKVESFTHPNMVQLEQIGDILTLF